MNLYLMRHGESALAHSDDERPLTKKGTEDIEKLARFISHLNIEVDKAFHSGKLRAAETAKIICSCIAVKENLAELKDLDPLAPILPMIDQINSWKKNILLVGHLPFMEKLVTTLITNEKGPTVITFKPGTLACLMQEFDQWVINWVIHPTLLDY